MSTTPTTHNPFGWRLAEIADPRTDDPRRQDLIESLIVAEAEELALGRRHLTVFHGAPESLPESQKLDAFYDEVFAAAEVAEWSRIRGTEDFVTITLGGTAVDEHLLDVVELAHRANPGGWKVMERPFPLVE